MESDINSAAASVFASPLHHVNVSGDTLHSTDVVEAEAHIGGAAPSTGDNSLHNTYCNGPVKTDTDILTGNDTNSESDSDEIMKDSSRFSPSPKFPMSIADLYVGSGSETESDDTTKLVANVRNALENEENPNGKHFYYKTVLHRKNHNAKDNEKNTKRLLSKQHADNEHHGLSKCNESSTLGTSKSLGGMGSNDDRAERDQKRLEHFQRITQSRKNVGVLDYPKYLR